VLQMRHIVNPMISQTGGLRRSLALQDTEGTPWHTRHSTTVITPYIRTSSVPKPRSPHCRPLSTLWAPAAR
jgi:hypothetical protein